MGVFAGTRAADARGDLFPISHILGGIVSADDLDGQETPANVFAKFGPYVTLLSVFD